MFLEVWFIGGKEVEVFYMCIDVRYIFCEKGLVRLSFRKGGYLGGFVFNFFFEKLKIGMYYREVMEYYMVWKWRDVNYDLCYNMDRFWGWY